MLTCRRSTEARVGHALSKHLYDLKCPSMSFISRPSCCLPSEPCLSPATLQVPQHILVDALGGVDVVNGTCVERVLKDVLPVVRFQEAAVQLRQSRLGSNASLCFTLSYDPLSTPEPSMTDGCTCGICRVRRVHCQRHCVLTPHEFCDRRWSGTRTRQ